MDLAQSRPKTGHQTIEQIAWHSFPLGDVFLHLNSKRDGLSDAEAQRRLARFGLNRCELKKGKTIWKIFLRQFLNPLIIILIIAGVLTVFLKSFLDAIVICIVILINSFIGFFQEYQARQSLKSLEKINVESSLVLRDGNYVTKPASEIVPGDIALLKAGDKVPADARIINSFDLRVDESILTGESKDVFKHSGMVSAGKNIFERTNIVFGGTLVTDGNSEVAIFGTGENSEIGRIGRLVRNISDVRTPFEKKIHKLSRLIALTILFLSLIILISGIFLGRDAQEMFLVAVAVAVAAIPENLPVAITVILVIGMKRILKNGGLVKNLSVAENLGAASVILTDKIGTLTQGEMRVVKILTPERKSGMLEMDSTLEHTPSHRLVSSYGFLVSEAVIENPDDEVGSWIIRGSPVDRALVLAAVRTGLDFKKINQKFKKLGQISFNSERKFSVSFREEESGEIWALIVGAPDVLLNRVKKLQILNRYENIITFEYSVVKEAVDAMAKDGLRVLAVCSKKIENRSVIQKHIASGDFTEIISGLNLVGLIGLKDPIRPDVRDFLEISRKAGIRTVMVTGDHPYTARAVAKEIGLVAKEKYLPETAEGKDIINLDVKDLGYKVRNIDIFSRVTPEQKLKITEAWQSQGEVVAVIGDGVNDAAALRRADIGVALAQGVDLAKDASGLVLLENSFSVLVKAIQEGRVISDNIKKVVAYLLSTSLTEIVLVGLSLLFGWPLPVLAVQILWVNLVNESLPAVALAMDPAERDVMDLKPQDASSPIVDNFIRFLIGVVGCVSAVILFLMFIFFKFSFNNTAYAQSVVFVGLGVSALFSSFSVRSLRQPIWDIPFFENRYLLGATAVGILLLASAVYLPPLRFILRSQPIGFLDWVIILGAGVFNIILIETAKWFFVKKSAKFH